nr:unnamed protein product [Callosobruchus analis]
MSRKRFGALMVSNVVASARAALMHSSRCLAALSMSEGVFTSGRGPRFPWIRFLTSSKFTRLTMRGSFRMGSLSNSSRSRMMGLWSELPSMIVHVSATYCPPRRMAVSMTSGRPRGGRMVGSSGPRTVVPVILSRMSSSTRPRFIAVTDCSAAGLKTVILND